MEQQFLFTGSCYLELIMRDKQQTAMKLQEDRGCSSCEGTLWEQVLPLALAEGFDPKFP